MTMRTGDSPRGSAIRPPSRLGRPRRALATGWRLAARRPGLMLAGAAVIGGAGFFSWNVLMSQTARHPAPLFAGAKPVVAATAPAEPPRRPEAAAPPLPTPRPEPASFAGRPEPTVTRSTDAIGALIRTGDGAARSGEARPATPSRPVEPKAAGAPRTIDPKPAAAPKLASAQKALAKLGYGPIAADGLMGTTTRQALERFERDKKLPVTGALGTRTAKLLTSASGIQVE